MADNWEVIFFVVGVSLGVVGWIIISPIVLPIWFYRRWRRRR